MSFCNTLEHNMDNWERIQDEKEFLQQRTDEPQPLSQGAWECNWCNNIQHQDQQPNMSVYHTFRTGSNIEGPMFCSHNCMCNWKSSNSRTY